MPCKLYKPTKLIRNNLNVVDGVELTVNQITVPAYTVITLEDLVRRIHLFLRMRWWNGGIGSSTVSTACASMALEEGDQAPVSMAFWKDRPEGKSKLKREVGREAKDYSNSPFPTEDSASWSSQRRSWYSWEHCCIVRQKNLSCNMFHTTLSQQKKN